MFETRPPLAPLFAQPGNQPFKPSRLAFTVGVLRHRIEQVVHAPKPVNHSGRHSRRRLEAAVHPAQVVNGDMDRSRRGKVFELLGEAQSQPRESSHKRANRQVVSLNVRGAYRREIVYPVDVDSVCLHQVGRRVPAHLGVDVVLYQDAVPDGALEMATDRGNVGVPTVRAQLGAFFAEHDRRSDQAFLQVGNEGVRHFAIALADGERDQQLGVRVQCRVKVLVADPVGAEPPFIGLFFLHPAERPDFVELDVLQMQVGQRFIEECAAICPEAHHKSHDRALVDAGQSHHGADRIPFRQKPQNLNLLVPAEEVGHRIRPIVCDESVTIQVSRLELDGDVWFQLARWSLQRPSGFLCLPSLVDSIIVNQVAAVNLIRCKSFKKGDNAEKEDARREATRSWPEAGLSRGAHRLSHCERAGGSRGRAGRASREKELEPLGSRHRGNPGAACHQKRRQGVTIPSVSARTPPAAYKTAAPPRRGPFSGFSRQTGRDDIS